jgi:hypothetical protein
MAEAILKFDLTDADDKLEFERANKSLDFALAIWSIVHNTRKGIEYEMESKLEKPDPAERPDVFDGIDAVYTAIFEILEEHQIVIDKYIV